MKNHLVTETSSLIINRIKKLNSMRLQRVHSTLSEEQMQLFTLIPYLFQTNHIQLPGFIDAATPFGVVNFTFSEALKSACSALNIAYFDNQSQQPNALEGVYAMGSSASFGQNHSSDVDIWLVYQSSLSVADVELLGQKAVALTQWFANWGFEVNFYLVHPNQFRECGLYDNCQPLGEEHSGSVQHWLLLEEFFRSHICLAGKYIAWWPKASGEDLLYLGDPTNLPASEYFGASLWQLYKGLNKPHKALLKVMLLEVYASEYPNNHMITEQIWDFCSRDDFSANNDAYLQLYLRIEAYLLARREVRRLEIVRRCFYLKCGVALSDPTRSKQDWRYNKLLELTHSWKWPSSLLITLDNAKTWHSGQLQWFNQQLNELLLASYKNLLHFATKYELSDRMRVEDLGLLARKLHGFFNEDKHSLPFLNPLWSQGVSEDQLAVCYSKKDTNYHLFRGCNTSQQLLGQQALFVADTATAVVAWAVLNGLVTEHTQWAGIESRKVFAVKLALLSKKLLPQINHKVKVTKRNLCQPWFYQQVIVVVNMNDDATRDWHGQEIMVDYMNGDVLSLGREKNNMVSNIDVITLNSWGEWHSHCFEGETGLLDAISFLVVGVKRADAHSHITVLSCSKKLVKQIEDQLSQLLELCYQTIQKVTDSQTLLIELNIGKSKYGLHFNSLGVVFKLLDGSAPIFYPNKPRLVTHLPRPELSNEPFSAVPVIIQRYISVGAKQYFFRQLQHRVEIILVDEHNALTHTIEENCTIQSLVNEHSLRFVKSSHKDQHAFFNMPQFFQLIRREGDLLVEPFGVSEDEMGSAF
ncbi:class I adenylate cyclase [Shewanella gaetbuli]|uniref:Adenylate cyclase n=1 Tax=Shewanella gaetbuli TaxID=220752 RepID=A0A9X1ZNF5_9GAMM|nr:class I adenylate cyclase [Shewanella gaetbuli]MCL1141088.1 class I adenylate cyclase [Shewanella gaetbuli]